MQAAEQFFEGKFDHIKDDDDGVASNAVVQRTPRPAVNFDLMYAYKINLARNTDTG